jgi:hypothetical protein
MDYQSANQQLQGRCFQSRKLGNNTYLQRRDEDIAVRLHSTDVITFHPDGSITLDTGGWETVTTKDRINSYQPHSVWSERGTWFLTVRGKQYVFEDGITIRANGTVEGYETDAQREKALAEVYAEWRKTDRERSRMSRWLSRARGLKRTHRCHRRWCRCHPSPWRGRTLQLGTCRECGCVVERYQPKTKLTVADIVTEPNITVRMAMVQVYGLEKFLLDAGAKTIDCHGDYHLLDLPMGDWQTIRALKMVCPGTHAVYISPVEPRIKTVPEALDWYFQTENYLGSVTQES